MIPPEKLKIESFNITFRKNSEILVEYVQLLEIFLEKKDFSGKNVDI